MARGQNISGEELPPGFRRAALNALVRTLSIAPLDTYDLLMSMTLQGFGKPATLEAIEDSLSAGLIERDANPSREDWFILTPKGRNYRLSRR
jgi:hypothetical protein